MIGSKKKVFLAFLSILVLVISILSVTTGTIPSSENARNIDNGTDNNMEGTESRGVKDGRELKNDYDIRDPIRINNNSDFHDQADEEDWPGNGGEDDPYIIKGYEIDGHDYGYCIYIGNTTVHFELRDNYVFNASGGAFGEYFRNSGIHLRNITNAVIANNTVTNNGEWNDWISGRGIRLWESNNNVIKGNTVMDNGLQCIQLWDSSSNTIMNNTQSNNVAGQNDGIVIRSSSSDNTFSGNTISDNDWVGLYIDEDSDDNMIYRNSFIENSVHAYDEGINDWDGGDPAEEGKGGNYWSDYDGEDRGDGIGDEPYNIPPSDWWNEDEYPWMNPQMIHPAGSFIVSIDNITADESPVIEISNAYDVHDNLMDGVYTVEIKINGNSMTEDLNFIDGYAEYTWSEITTAGEYTANVTIDGVNESDDFYVDTLGAEYISITPDDETVPAGYELEYTVTAFDTFGNDFDVTSKTNFSDNIEKSEWDENMVTPKTAGRWEVIGEYEGLEDITNLTVTSADASEFEVNVEDFIAGNEPILEIFDAHDGYGNPIEGNYTVEVEINGDSIAEDLNFTEGYVEYTWNKMTQAGEYTVELKLDGIISSDNFYIVPADVDSVLIEPSEDQIIEAGEMIEFSAKSFDEYGNLIEDDDTAFTWENADETGLFQKTEARDYEVTASYEEEVSETIMVTVEPAEVDYVLIEPSEDQIIKAGEMIEFSAKSFDEYGNLIEDDDTAFTWRNTDKTGLFQEAEPGEYEVTATSHYEAITSEPTIVTVVVEDFEVEIIDYDDEVEEGDTVIVDFKITNTGDIEGTQNIVFSVDGTNEAIEENITVGAGDTFDGQFTWTAEEEDNYKLEVASEDDEDTVTVTVGAEEFLDVPGFTTVLLILSAVIAVALYYKKEE